MNMKHTREEIIHGYTLTETAYEQLSRQALATLDAGLGINDSVIAAASEMLEVARLVLTVDNARSAQDYLRELARAAIAKATGDAL